MKIKVSDYIAEWMKEKGIKHVFTVTGGGAMHLNDSFGKHPDLECIYNHHEQASAMAAESYARINKQIALVCVTSGPGGTNAITGVLGGWLDSIPMLIISGQVKYETTVRSTSLPLRQLGDQEFDITKSVSTMTKYAEMVIEPEDIKYHLEKAYFLAMNGRPGPCWLDIPLNVQGAFIDMAELKEYDNSEDKKELDNDLTKEKIEEVISKIETAQKPAILVGAGVRLSGSAGKLNEFIKQLNIPVMTAWNSHDLVENANPLYAGRPGTVGTRGGNFVFQNTDVLLVIGCRMNLRQIGYAKNEIAPNAFKIMVDIDKFELQKDTFKVDLPVHCDCSDFIDAMIDSGFKKDGAGHERWIKWCKDINVKYHAVEGPAIKEGRLNPYLFLERMFRMLPEEQVTVTGNGSACVISFQTAEIKKKQRLYTNSGCASMGYGLPGAIGACMASDKKSTVCIEGDGSLQMNIQELQTIVKNKLPLKIFVLNNNGYVSIRQTQKNFFEGRFSGIDSDTGVSFPELSKISTAYGIDYVRIDNEGDIEDNVNKLINSSLPVICEVVVDPEQVFVPKSASRLLSDGKMSSAPLHDMFPFLGEDEMKGNWYE